MQFLVREKNQSGPTKCKNIGHVWLVVELEKMPLALLNLPGYILAPSLGRIQGGLLSLQMRFCCPYKQGDFTPVRHLEGHL